MAVVPFAPVGNQAFAAAMPSSAAGFMGGSALATGGQALGSSLGMAGKLDFDPVGDFFQCAGANTTMGMRQTVKNRAGQVEEKTLQMSTNQQGQVLEHFCSVGTGMQAGRPQETMQRQMRYCHGPSGLERHVEERSVGQQAVRAVYEVNKVTGEDRRSEMCRGVAEVADFNALWRQQAALPALNQAGLALPGGLVMVPPDPSQIRSALPSVQPAQAAITMGVQGAVQGSPLALPANQTAAAVPASVFANPVGSSSQTGQSMMQTTSAIPAAQTMTESSTVAPLIMRVIPSSEASPMRLASGGGHAVIGSSTPAAAAVLTHPSDDAALGSSSQTGQVAMETTLSLPAGQTVTETSASAPRVIRVVPSGEAKTSGGGQTVTSTSIPSAAVMIARPSVDAVLSSTTSGQNNASLGAAKVIGSSPAALAAAVASQPPTTQAQPGSAAVAPVRAALGYPVIQSSTANYIVDPKGRAVATCAARTIPLTASSPDAGSRFGTAAAAER
jgi:hypothetical protein